MNQVNNRGTFMVTKFAIPYLKKAKNPHVMILCPPPNMSAHWFGNHLPYSMAKYGMTMSCLGFGHEHKKDGIAVNGLWPLTTVATAAINNVLGGSTLMNLSRTTDIMSDAAYEVLTADAKTCTGNFFVDEDVMRHVGVTDFSKYKVDKRVPDDQILPDFFLEVVRTEDPKVRAYGEMMKKATPPGVGH